MGMRSARWVPGLLLAGLVLPGCCSTCGKGNCFSGWGSKSNVASNNIRPLPPAGTYPGAPSGMAGNTMAPPPGAVQPAGGMQAMPTQGSQAGYSQPRGLTGTPPASTYQPITPGSTPPASGPDAGQGNYYSKPVGYSRMQAPGSSPLMDSTPPANMAGSMSPSSLPPSNITPVSGSEPPPPAPPSQNMPPMSSTPAGSTEAPLVPPSPPMPPRQ